MRYIETVSVPTGKFKEFFRLFFPIFFILFSTSLFVLVEKVLLACLSVEEMEAAVTIAFVSMIFQVSCAGLAMMAQVAVAKWYGAGHYHAIGPGIWQFIWFSIFSMIITVPIGLLYGNYFLAQTSIQKIALPYFHFTLWINFLIPLGSALSCFYLGQGKTRFVLLSTLGSQILKISLAYLLILGKEPWIPSLGLMGGGISTLIAQGGFCLLLFIGFLHSKNANKYLSRVWYFHPKLFWQYIQPGLLRAVNRISQVICWTSIAHIMVTKGGDYLIILSIGGALALFLPFIGEAISQTETILLSQVMGANRHYLLNKILFIGLICAIFFAALIAIPLIAFPAFTFAKLFPEVSLDFPIVQRLFFGVWSSFVSYTIGYVGVGYILASKDMYFYFFMGFFIWINGYLLMYIALEHFLIPADLFWTIYSFMHASTACLYFLRLKRLHSRIQLSKTELLS